MEIKETWENELKIKTLEKAKNCLKKALDSNPTDRRTLLLLGDVYFKLANEKNLENYYLFADHCYRSALTDTPSVSNGKWFLFLYYFFYCYKNVCIHFAVIINLL